MTTLADKIEALAKDATPGPWMPEDDDIMTTEGDLIAGVYPGGYTRNGRVDDKRREANTCLITELVNNLPTILRALRERDQAVEALRLFVRLMNDPDYDLGELCEEFCTRAETILASIEGTGHDD